MIYRFTKRRRWLTHTRCILSTMIILFAWLPDLGARPLTAFAIDPDDSQIRYAGGDMNGLSKSVDGGSTWDTIWESYPGDVVDRHISGIVVDPYDAETVYVSIDNFSFSVDVGGVFKSTDGGQTWMTMNSGLPEASVSFMKVDPHHPDVLYVRSHGELHKTVDGGTNWQNISPVAFVQSLEVSPDVPSAVYAIGSDRNQGEGDTLFRSPDGGASWQHGLPTPDGVHILDIAASSSDGDILFSSGWHTQDGLTGSVFSSLDGGTNWTLVWELKGGRISTLVVDPRDPRILYAGSSGKVDEPGLFRSTDGGQHWTRIHPGSVVDITLDPQDADAVHVGSRFGGIVSFAFQDLGTIVERISWSNVKKRVVE